jgi:hypothetical protein
LLSVKELTANFGSALGSLPALSMSWSNCANQLIQFDITYGNTLYVTISTYGQVSTVGGYLGSAGLLPEPSSVAAHSTVTVTLPIVGYAGNVSPNAIVQSVLGTLTATDPTTGQAISIPTNFTT